MDRAAFEQLMERLGRAWNEGDASTAAACFAEAVDYADPRRYRWRSRAQLESFFAPPPGGHGVTWHRLLFDELAQTGVAEYTYVGHHRYHGAAIVELDADGCIRSWREWQHLEDEREWSTYVQGPSE